MSKVGGFVARAVAAAVLFAASVEVAFRVAPEDQTVQRVDLRGEPFPEVRWVDGVALWRVHGSAERENLSCNADDAVHVWLVGSSITFGVELPAAEALGARLQARFDADMPGQVCVHDRAQPAYSGPNKGASVTELLAETEPGAASGRSALRPDVVVWELWNNEPCAYTRADPWLWSFCMLVTDEGGLPAMGVPPAVNAGLWARSAAWRWWAVHEAQRVADVDPNLRARDYARDVLPASVARIRDAGVRPLAWVAAPLDQGWAEGRAQIAGVLAPVLALLGDAGWPVVWAAELLADQDPAAIGRDSCCHLNAVGSDRLAERLFPALRAEVEQVRAARAVAYPPPSDVLATPHVPTPLPTRTGGEPR